jgi:hypothetical protein
MVEQGRTPHGDLKFVEITKSSCNSTKCSRRKIAIVE